MKYSFRKFLTVMIIMMIVVSSSVFAKGSSEQNSANEVIEVTEKSEENSISFKTRSSRSETCAVHSRKNPCFSMAEGS